VRGVAEEVRHSQALLEAPGGGLLGPGDQTLVEDTLDCLKDRLAALGSALGRRCEHMRTRMHELTAYQVPLLS